MRYIENILLLTFKKKERMKLLNGFQRKYLTRNHLLPYFKETFYSFYDPATDRYHSMNADEFLDCLYR